MGLGGVRGGSRVRERQQAAVARLGQHALAGADLGALMAEAAHSAARELGADYSKVLELLPEGDRLLMRAGVGWASRYYGTTVVEGGVHSQAGYTLLASEPIILEDVSREVRFSLASLHRDHKITSGVTVVIPGDERPFGVLGVYTSEIHAFSEDDINFLQAIANVLAAAIERKAAEEERERLLEEMRHLAVTTQRRAAELRGVLDNMLDAVFVIDSARRVILINSAGLNMLGLAEPPRQSEPHFVLRLRRPDGSDFGEDHPLLRALAGDSVALEDAVITGTDGRPDVNVRVNAAPIRDEQGIPVGAVAVSRDTTALIEIERLKDQFISMAAHELKTPVAVMKGYSQALLRSGSSVPASGRQMLAAIDRGSDRIDRIVTDLLDISRFHFGEPDFVNEPVELARLAHQAAERVALAAPRHQILVEAEGEVTARSDEARLRQVLVNLLDNAVKYSPGGGVVAVRVTSSADEAFVSVTDHGIGIPSEGQPRIFERFFRAHSGTEHDYGGMGVGLYISRQIIHSLKGRIWFTSSKGEGSTFSFSLPLLPHEGDQLAES